MRYIIIAPLILASIVSAALTITEPSAAHWWVAQSLNTLAWDGTDPTEFSVFLANSDSNVLTSMLALASIVPTYQTSLTINPGDATPATGYTLLITNPLNSSDVYATSGSFEIKAVGSVYPPQGTVSVNTSTNTTQGTGSQTGSALASTPSATASSSSSTSGCEQSWQ
ncbi:hypothetical protein C343_00328 [Cryptococcus neoformans C23]|uniref:Yeast cell wall synthesis Kre9/Knh1-like N-terminal domain-containing protein n=1 Tax=Cryptococcus neoformans (strain H99 / ATCC 208821 / CBS 10515 / FGSC 9487) TaxID=235443 RepID=J9VEK9_CRYN9|nr:hypothetical protein CNAG_00323 [Cryptococcus neoformans var. grubii H99]AUB21891.1 hypothetical protein CKF44_00323 [Cryptococcus neoformans var. grubii]OWZ37045.1 hypothetical protein C347_00405 [Cryptococcus neoformans var. grubii AD2-60a]OWZ48876.1 hypothetical protein C343_00328 [Cryptococcus neoformans var. grubii C23]OXC87390.1 hypothetical protein C344_00340 [Cryptococcus neoformans var. grubii AD1-7a]AFR92458.1 hypothetical protein CNAG_00323 [Cryptococcus neoformans var. grubii H9|eukprot:XP_012046654.1 hypothetical protein CNAG_00323 [Cryptococcus neoformans var. grubii H99]